MSAAEPLTAQERERLDAIHAELAANGYQDIAAHITARRQLRVGDRIRHIGQQWPEAFDHGTGHIAVLTEKPGSKWSQDHGRPDVELIAVWDKPRLANSRISQLADYHVELTTEGHKALEGAS